MHNPVFRLRFMALAALVISGPLPTMLKAQETVLRCDTVTDGGAQRVICEQRPVNSDFKVPLPPQDIPLGGFEPKTQDNAVSKPSESIASAPIIFPKDSQGLLILEPPAPVLAILPPTAPTAPVVADSIAREPLAMPAEVLQAALKQMANSKRLDRVTSEELSRFYQKRNYAPLWLEKTGWTAPAKSVRSQLAKAFEDGLDTNRYHSVSIIDTNRYEWPALAAAELELSASAVAYAGDISTGRIAPRQVHAMITPKLERPETEFVMARLAEAVTSGKNAGEILHAFAPPQEGYIKLRERLMELRKQRTSEASIVIPDGPVLRVGMKDRRVPLIRLRLDAHEGSGDTYDQALATKVAVFQRSMRLLANTVITPQTIKALNTDRYGAEEADIITNMEFWRWLPRDLGENHIFVNVPSYGLQLLQANKVVHEARVIVGTDETQTPIFSDSMDHIVVNPSWFVPPSILKKDPRYLDPEWLKARGYTMIKRRNSVIVRVPPGATNALGNVKFMFPNDHAVYLHDTPKRGLFNARERILSNGCVRVENPFKLAAKIFEGAGFSEDRFKRMIGGGEQRMNLPNKLPIHLAYFTASFDSSGNLVRHRDVYGHAARLKQLLGLS